MTTRSVKSTVFSFTILVLTFFSFACNKDSVEPSVNQSAPVTSQASPAPSPLTGFEKDLQYIRNGQYTYVWIFSRKDGKPLDKEDGAYLRTNAPQVVDWVTTDEGKKVIGGTNFNLEEGNLAALKKRFVAEDYSGR
jgi:hypothetical protein